MLVNEIRECVIKLGDQHTELCSPVTYVVHTLNIVAKEFENTANRVTLDGAAQVTHMHVFCDVWA